MDYTAHGILQARILEWVASPFSRGSSQPRHRTQVSCIAGRFFTSRATGKPKNTGVGSLSLLQQIFPIQESNPVSSIASRFSTNWAIREAQEEDVSYNWWDLRFNKIEYQIDIDYIVSWFYYADHLIHFTWHLLIQHLTSFTEQLIIPWESDCEVLGTSEGALEKTSLGLNLAQLQSK